MSRSDLVTHLVGEGTFISTFTHTLSLKLLKSLLPVNLVKKQFSLTLLLRVIAKVNLNKKNLNLNLNLNLKINLYLEVYLGSVVQKAISLIQD